MLDCSSRGGQITGESLYSIDYLISLKREDLMPVDLHMYSEMNKLFCALINYQGIFREQQRIRIIKAIDSIRRTNYALLRRYS